MIKPNIFDFKDSNLFFRSMVDYLRDKDQFSNRNFAKSLRLKSHSLVPMLYYGNRKISLKMVGTISKAFELDSDEQSYFYLLVKLEHSSNTPEVPILNKKLERLKRKRGFRVKSLPDDSDFFSSWIYPLLYVSIPLKRELLDKAYLSSQLRIGEAELSKAIQKLQKLNLIDANQNGLKRNFHFIKKDGEDHRATQYSMEMLAKAYNKIRSQGEIADIIAMAQSMRVTKESYERIKLFLDLVMREITENYANPDSADQIIQINVECFKVFELGELKSNADTPTGGYSDDVEDSVVDRFDF